MALFKIATAHDLHQEVRQAAAIYLKRLSIQWETEEGPFFANDKTVIRDHILEAIAYSPPLIRFKFESI